MPSGSWRGLKVPLLDVPRLADQGWGGAEIDEARTGGGGNWAQQQRQNRQVTLPDALRFMQRDDAKARIEAALQLIEQLVVARVLVVAVIATPPAVGLGRNTRRVHVVVRV